MLVATVNQKVRCDTQMHARCSSQQDVYGLQTMYFTELSSPVFTSFTLCTCMGLDLKDLQLLSYLVAKHSAVILSSERGQAAAAGFSL